MRRRTALRTCAPATLSLAALLTACGQHGGPQAQLFPLEPGYRWTYRQTTDMEDGRHDVSTLVLRTLPRADFEGRPAWRRHSDDGVDYWLRRDDTGIYRIATRHELQGDAQRDSAHRYVLKQPIAAGTQWQASTVPYLLERRQGFPPELRNEGKAVMMNYVIESTKDKVSVPAGTFDSCVKVRGLASRRLYADAVVGWKDLPLTTLEWYCPGPGLVKVERDEPAKSPFLIGGRTVLELQDWQQP